MFKKILTSFSVVAITSSSFLVVACGTKLSRDDKKPLNDIEFNKIINNINDSNKLEEYADLSFKLNSRVIPKNQVLPSQWENNPKMLSVILKEIIKIKLM